MRVGARMRHQGGAGDVVLIAKRIGGRASIALVLSVALVLAVAPSALAKSRNSQRLELKSMAGKATNSSLKYLHTTWWNSLYSIESTVTTLPPSLAEKYASEDESGSTEPTESLEIADPFGGFSAGEKPIRSQASALYATALALKTGVYSSRVVRVSKEEARRRVIAWSNSLALSYERDGWGHGFQSALWVYYLHFGARQVWWSLPESTRSRIESATASEADWLSAAGPRFYRDASGTVVFVGDTKSEEDAWNGALLQLAALQTPGAPHAEQWLDASRAFNIAAYSSPDQVGTDERITGSNVNPDGSVTNGGREVYPDYMFTQAEFIAKNSLLALQVRKPVGREIYNNQRLIWRGLTCTKYASPPFCKPGGTIYRRDKKWRYTADIYYPSDTTRSRRRKFNAAQTDVEAFASRWDSRSYSWAKAHLAALLKQQARHKDGRVFSLGETRFPEDEQFAAATEAEMYYRLSTMK
jgi:hypothetical protein